MLTLGAYEVKTHFAEILERVGKGEQVVITKHLRPLARLIPEGDSARQPVTETIAAIRGLPSRGRLTTDEIADMIAEGRR